MSSVETLTERIQFKLYHMPCCGHLLCWVNPRKPTFCPQCGKLIFTHLTGECIKVADDDATITYHHKP